MTDTNGDHMPKQTLTDFLLQRIAEDKRRLTPRSVVVSGGFPAPEVPSCIGPSGTGDCPEGWSLEPEPSEGWWKRSEIIDLMRRHELTHATEDQRRGLAECEAKRRIVERWKDLTYEVEQAERLGDYDAAPVATAFAYEQVIEVLTSVYSDHPDFDPSWRVG